MKSSTWHRQTGLSLIELLIALAISSLLILGITQIYIDNKSNYIFQQSQSDNTENARYTLLVLEEELRRVGYRIRPDDEFENAFRGESVGNCSFNNGEVINYNRTAQRLCIRYQPYIPDLTACDGIARTAPPEPYNVGNAANIVVELDFFSDQLRCNGQPVFDDLVDFEMEFGVSTNGSREANFYTSNPAANQAIQSVRYAALIRSRFDNVADTNQSQAYEDWFATRRALADQAAPDRALYLMTESTINLRNLTR